MTKVIKINYVPNPGQAAFHASKARYKAMVGALGSGKTATGIVEAIMLSLEYPGNIGLIARASMPELKMSTMQTFFEFCPDDLILAYNKTDNYVQLRTNGKPSTIYFGPLDQLHRYRSAQFGFYFMDEADEVGEDIWRTLAGRLRLPGVRQCGMLATNPTTVSHWIYKLFVADPPPNYELFRSKTEDNAANLPPGYIESLRQSYPEDWQKRYLDGEFGIIQEGDPVFPDFSEKLHVKPVTHEMGRPILRGWDFGYNHPCVVFAEFDDAGRFKILDHILGEKVDLDVFAERVIRYTNEKWPKERVEDYCDPAGIQQRDTGKPSVTVLNEKRIYPKYRLSRPSERAMEIRKLMRQMIGGQPAFQIDPKNTYLIEMFTGGAQYAKLKDGTMTDEIKKDGYFEHGFDAVGYIIANTVMRQRENTSDRQLNIPQPKWFTTAGSYV